MKPMKAMTDSDVQMVDLPTSLPSKSSKKQRQTDFEIERFHEISI